MGQAPGVGVKHRNNGQDLVALAHTQTVGHHRGHGVQECAAMGVHHALRITCRATRVTHAGGSVLRDFNELRRCSFRE